MGSLEVARLCEYCDKELSGGRADRRFCNAKCRVHFNKKELPKLIDPEETTARMRKIMTEMNVSLKEKGLPLMVLGADLPPTTFISSGVAEIDLMTGGIPRKKVTEIYGPKGVGKTTLMSRIVSSLDDLKICYIDAEGGLPTPPSNVLVNTEHILERAQDVVEDALEKNLYDLIVVDSIASLVPRAEVEGDPGDVHMGLKARLMSQWMRKIHFHLSKSNTAVVFINQQRESMNPYGPSKFTPGGFGVPYAASLRLELKSNKVDKADWGQWVHVEVEKSRVCKPYQKTKFKLLYA